MKQLGNITIRNSSPSVAVIDIEGVIGVPEQWQFDDDSDRVATYARFAKALDSLRELDCERIRVNIRSTGGNINDALLIYESLCMLPAAVETHCYGYVASAATVIAQAASAGSRYVSSGSLYLIHNSQTTLEGNKQAAIRTLEMLEKTDGRIAQIYADRSGMPVEGFVSLMSDQDGNGKWLTPEEAVGYGLADQIEKSNPIKDVGRKIKGFGN